MQMIAYGPPDATATLSSLAPVKSRMAEWFTFLVLAHPDCPGKRPINGCSSSSTSGLKRTGIRFIADSLHPDVCCARDQLPPNPLWFPFHCCVENGYDRVDLCRPWDESQRPVLPRCLTLSADAASNQAGCKRHVCLSTIRRSISLCKDTIKLLQQETPDFTGPDLWPPNSQDLNQVDSKSLGCYAAESVWMSYEQCQWAEAAPHWHLEQSAAERYWCGHQRLEKATESMHACRWTTFWTFIVSACDWQKLRTNKI